VPRTRGEDGDRDRDARDTDADERESGRGARARAFDRAPGRTYRPDDQRRDAEIEGAGRKRFIHAKAVTPSRRDSA